ncbi:MAG: NAD-dependent epimerase/dehydratase family protein [Bryobacteraceae bacterium]
MTLIVILGCGFTGRRVARLLAAADERVVATAHRSAPATEGVGFVTFEAADPAAVAGLAETLSAPVRVLHSLPPMGNEPVTPLVAPVLKRAERVVYLSTTGVYGDQGLVDETTPPAPRIERERVRVAEEEAVRGLCGSWAILRPAAIYGPGRGVHVSLREGRHRLWGDGSNYISRIHVDDLARITAAAVLGDITGAWPVADDEPCPAIEITRYCAGLLGIAAPEPSGVLPPEDTRSANRRVDGRAIRRALGVDLRYPGYREGIAAAMAAERASGA